MNKLIHSIEGGMLLTYLIEYGYERWSFRITRPYIFQLILISPESLSKGLWLFEMN